MLGEDWVIVADRENFRVQIFTLDGEYVDQWHIHHPMSVTEGKAGDTSIYVGEMIPPPVQRGVPNLGARVSVLTADGELLHRLGAPLPGMARRSVHRAAWCVDRLGGESVRRRGGIHELLLKPGQLRHGGAAAW